MAEPAFYISTDQAREDEYVRQVYGPITAHVGQILTKKLESKA